MKPKKLSGEELDLLANPNHYRIRAQAYEKVHSWLQTCKSGLQAPAEAFANHFPDWKWQLSGKISRGENYKGFPWRVLDLPAVFEKEDLFLFRVMVLGGHHLSLHLILSGKMKSHFEPALKAHLRQHPDWEWSHQDSPWEWELNAETHSQTPPEAERTFLKVSKKLPISSYEIFPDFALKGWREISGVLFQESES